LHNFEIFCQIIFDELEQGTTYFTKNEKNNDDRILFMEQFGESNICENNVKEIKLNFENFEHEVETVTPFKIFFVGEG
jgi:hypothetical protein